ncbi:TPA: restriction endonuclease subunit S [Haemophilus influenzae]|uniref:restriction endonuclease subunit S n=1 Tax=Haemophilus influenzae TaxID=727 RepID=UPI000E3457BF|nr:restriction endonuclease subunit S [Haemophilus influenzae]MCK9679981.1 restriction endonuclease subunit S [Haemophilus influenzae]RFO62924.1 restriction endonuclease subunit S [Haemophilus influenzae]
MNDWQTVTLEDVTESINTGLDAIRRAPIVEHQTNLRCLRIQDISQDKSFNEWGFTETKKSDYDKYKLTSGDIIIARTGGSIGVNKLIRNDLESVFNNGLARIRVNKKFATPEFIYCVMQSINFKNHINAISSGTAAQPNMKVGDMAKFEFKLPPLNEQKKITDTIFAFIDKIHLNTQINQTLEQIAQALFKSWFVDFDPVRAKVQALSDGLSLEQAELAAIQAISGKTPEELTALSQTQPDRYAELAETAKAFPCEMVEVDGVEVPKGWGVKPLGDLISFVKGKKPKAVSPNQEENMLPHILTSSLEGKYNEFCESNKLVTVEYHNTIMLMDGSNSGRVAIGHNGVIGSTLAKINLDNNKLWTVIYQFLKHKEADIQANTTGTTIPHTDKNRVNNYLMVIPDNFLLEKFTELFDNSLLKIISNRNQIISLETTRDLLLPRLLNGEIQL